MSRTSIAVVSRKSGAGKGERGFSRRRSCTLPSTTADRSETGGAAVGGGGGGSSSSLVSPTSTSSTKRRHTSSSVAPFKAPQPPWKLSPTETLFRILCPADRTGGVIGKGGSIVRQFREETGARIRVDDPVPGSEDRVILIVAEAAPAKSKEVDGAEEEEASPAQRALVRVFERILRVDEERGGEGGVGEEKEIQGPVMCKLLVPSSQVGCVLGRGGKIVEKIRQESGAQIRVLAKEQVPSCAAAGDELIQITGNLLSVRKALLSVSGCLQNNPQPDTGNLATPKSLVALHGAPPPSDIFGQRGSVPGIHPQNYHMRSYPSNSGLDIITSGERRNPEEEVMFRMLCSNEKVGSIIGKGGVIVRALQNESGASIKVLDAVPDCEENVIVISAYECLDSKHSPTQDAILRVHSRLMDGVEKGSSALARLLVPSQQIGCLLGRGGNIIAEMRRSTGAGIRIFLKEHIPKCAQPTDEVVQVTGSLQSVQDALLHITSRIRETIFSLKPHSGIAAASYPSPAVEIPTALYRSRNESESPLTRPSTVFPHSHDRSASFSHNRDWQPSSSHSTEHFGLANTDRGSFSYTGEALGHHSTFNNSTSPRSWTKAANIRSIPDPGMGPPFRSGPIVSVGSGSQAAPGINMTVEVVVPQQYLEFIYGENGSDLLQIRELSGAKVVIHDPKPGTADGLVIISGTSDQACTAQTLLHAFVLCGKTAAAH